MEPRSSSKPNRGITEHQRAGLDRLSLLVANLPEDRKPIFESEVLKMGKPMDYKEAAEYLGVAENTLRKWVSTQHRGIPAHKMGGGKKSPVRFYADELDAWIKAMPSQDETPKEQPGKPTEVPSPGAPKKRGRPKAVKP